MAPRKVTGLLPPRQGWQQALSRDMDALGRTWMPSQASLGICRSLVYGTGSKSTEVCFEHQGNRANCVNG